MSGASQIAAALVFVGATSVVVPVMIPVLGMQVAKALDSL